ncbi:MAG: ferritin-like domain-containing protein [Acidimicrobiales bacterium]
MARLDLSGIDFAAFREDPLSPAALRCLRYMHDVEHHTVCYLRDLLVTPAHRDTRITTFLTLWNYEEMWHGEAIGQVLAAHDEAEGHRRIGPMRQRLGWRDRLSPILHSLGSSIAGETFPAIHMTWGAVNEWTTHAGYARLSNRAGHPVLTDLLARIMRQEGRHIAFYAAEAERRLTSGGRRTQWLVRRALRHLWWPVGSGVMPRSEVAFLVGELFGDDEGVTMARRIDQRIDRLPGLAGLHLVEGAVERCAADRSGSDDRAAIRSDVVDLQARRPTEPDQATAA